MFTLEPKDIRNESGINIGKRYEFIGEIKYGIDDKEIEKLSSRMTNIRQEALSDLIIFDFTKLKRWDSLGIRAVVPAVLEINKMLSQKGRTLLSVIGNIKADIYAAAKDKHPEISQDNFPWYDSFEDFSQANGL